MSYGMHDGIKLDSGGSSLIADIIVPTHGRPDLLGQLLATLAEQLRQSARCGLIIVNDGTHDHEYGELIKKYEGLIDYVTYEVSRGPAYARNVGARNSRGAFVIFTDDDCCP